jgi:hypothetical protein
VSHNFGAFLVGLVDEGAPDAIRRTPNFLAPDDALHAALDALAALADRNRPQTERTPS